MFERMRSRAQRRSPIGFAQRTTAAAVTRPIAPGPEGRREVRAACGGGPSADLLCDARNATLDRPRRHDRIQGELQSELVGAQPVEFEGELTDGDARGVIDGVQQIRDFGEGAEDIEMQQSVLAANGLPQNASVKRRRGGGDFGLQSIALGHESLGGELPRSERAVLSKATPLASSQFLGIGQGGQDEAEADRGDRREGTGQRNPVPRKGALAVHGRGVGATMGSFIVASLAGVDVGIALHHGEDAVGGQLESDEVRERSGEIGFRHVGVSSGNPLKGFIAANAVVKLLIALADPLVAAFGRPHATI